MQASASNLFMRWRVELYLPMLHATRYIQTQNLISIEHLKQEIPSEHEMGKLLSRKKRGRPKSFPYALDTNDVIDVDDEDYGDEDDIEEIACFPCSN